MNVICNFRIFDLHRYRKIQPVIESIKNNNSDKIQVILLIQEAINQTNTDIFNIYNKNNNDLKEIYVDYLQSALKLVQADRMSELAYSNKLETEDEDYIVEYIVEEVIYDNYFEAKGIDPIDMESLLDRNENDVNYSQVIDIIILLLCCPKYQESMGHDGELVSEGTVEYTNIYGSLYLFNQDIHDLIDNVLTEYQLENLHLFNRGVVIIKKEWMPRIATMVSKDLSNLCKSDNKLYLVTTDDGGRKYNLFSKSNLPQNSINESFTLADSELHNQLIAFYTSLNNMLSVVNSQPSYTIINEKLS
jgi:hypothetical protein